MAKTLKNTFADMSHTHAQKCVNLQSKKPPMYWCFIFNYKNQQSE